MQRIGLATGFVIVIAGLAWWQNHHRETRYDELIWQTAARHNLDPFLVKAVIRQESRFRPNVRGKAGEVGLMQITEGAVIDWTLANDRSVPFPGGVYDPAINLEVGCWYLAKACARWRGHPEADVLALSQYNAGPTRARRWAAFDEEKLLAAIPIASTRSYIVNVLSYRDEFIGNAPATRP
jgi:soluble lytic murein transglycosylase